MTSDGGTPEVKMDVLLCICTCGLCGCISHSNGEEAAAKVRSKDIDKKLNKERLTFRRTVRVLLLGAGESGKSTFLKQMRIIHGQEFDEEQVHEFRIVIYNNVLKGMRVLIDARQKLSIPWGDETCAKDGTKVFDFNGDSKLDQAVFSDYVDSLRRLWGDSGIRTAFDRRREFQLVSVQ